MATGKGGGEGGLIKDYIRVRDLEIRIEGWKRELAGKQALGLEGDEVTQLQDKINSEVAKLMEVNARLDLVEERERGRTSALDTAGLLQSTPAKQKAKVKGEEEKATAAQQEGLQQEALRLEAFARELQLKEDQLAQRERDGTLAGKATYSREEVTNMIQMEREARGRTVMEGNLLAISQSLADLRRTDDFGTGRGGGARRGQKMLGRMPEFDSAQDDFLLHCRSLNNYLTLNGVDDLQQKKLILILSLDPLAQLRCGEASDPSMEPFLGQTFSEFVKELKKLFLPPAQALILKQAFASLKQSKEQSVSDFLNLKYMRWKRSAEPTSSFLDFWEAAIASLYSGDLRAELWRLEADFPGNRSSDHAQYFGKLLGDAQRAVAYLRRTVAQPDNVGLAIVSGPTGSGAAASGSAAALGLPRAGEGRRVEEIVAGEEEYGYGLTESAIQHCASLETDEDLAYWEMEGEEGVHEVGQGERRCHECDSPLHLVRACPRRLAMTRGGAGGGWYRGGRGAWAGRTAGGPYRGSYRAAGGQAAGPWARGRGGRPPGSWRGGPSGQGGGWGTPAPGGPGGGWGTGPPGWRTGPRGRGPPGQVMRRVAEATAGGEEHEEGGEEENPGFA